MKQFLKKSMLLILAVCLVLPFGLILSACGKRDVWTPPKRIVLALPENVHVEYTNDWLKGDSSLPSYCVLMKSGNLYYVKTPHKYYSSNRLEVYVKANLKNGVEFSGPQYSQGHISACWNDYSNSWVLAKDETQFGESYAYHANDQNGSVYYKGTDFLNSGYGDVNHPYDNGVTDKYGYTHTATKLENETVTVGDKQVECVVWEYSFTTSDPTVYSREKFWFEAQTGITIQRSSITYSSANQSLDAEENIGLKATYFSITDTMQGYLESINRWPAPNFSSYH